MLVGRVIKKKNNGRRRSKRRREEDKGGMEICCPAQFLYIPAASSGINLRVSPPALLRPPPPCPRTAKANTPTHLTHAFTAVPFPQRSAEPVLGYQVRDSELLPASAEEEVEVERDTHRVCQL